MSNSWLRWLCLFRASQQHLAQFEIRAPFLIALAVGLPVVQPPTVHAAKFWKNSVVTGTWSAGNDWSATSAASTDNGDVPLQGEAVNIVNTDGTARTVTYDVNAPALGYGIVSIDLTGAGMSTNTLSITGSNNLSGAIIVGGYSGSGPTNGRGSLVQSAGTVKTTAGLDLGVGYGANSTGTYTLGGTGTLEALQSEYVGLSGTGTFTQNAGANTVDAGSIGGFDVGAFAGSHGTYNLNGGALTSNKSEYIGDAGIGAFVQTGGTNTVGFNTVSGTPSNLYLGFTNGGAGTYTVANSASLSVTGDAVIGNAGTAAGTLVVQDQASVSIANNLIINSHGTVNLSGGILRFNGYSQQPAGIFNFTGGTVRLAGSRTIGTDATISSLFGASATILTGKGLTVEGATHVQSNVAVSGGKLIALSSLDLGSTSGAGTISLTITNGGTVHSESDVSLGSAAIINSPGSITVDGTGSGLDNLGNISIGRASAGVLQVSGGGAVTTGGNATIGSNGVNGQGTATVTGAGSSWMIAGNLSLNGVLNGVGNLTVQNQASISVGGALSITGANAVNLSGGTLRLNTVTGSSLSGLNFSAGIIELSGDRNLGSDAIVQTLFGVTPVIPTGKGLMVDGTATLSTTTTLNGGTFSAGQLVNPQLLQVQSGTVDVTNQVVTIAPGAQLDLPTNATINYTLGISNQGLITGDGHLGGTMQNTATGEIRADSGKTLTLTGANNTNDGHISLLGGTAAFTQNLTNNAGGSVTGSGTLMASAIVNQGAMSFSGTASLVSNSIDLHGQVSVATAATLNLVSQSPALLAGVTNVNHGTIAASHGILFGTPQLRDDVTTALVPVSVITREQAQLIQSDLESLIQDRLDTLSDMSELDSLRLQMYLDRVTKATQEVSNVLHDISGTQDAIIGNIKSTLQTDTEILGQFVPGGSAGIASVHITGQTTFDSGSKLALEFEGTGAGQFDALQVDSGVHFQYGTRLALSLLDPSDPQNGTSLFAPNIGDHFDVVSAPTIDAEYLQVDMPALAGRAFVAGVVDNPSGGQVLRITVIPGVAPLSHLPGDYNNNGVVDAADYTVWRDFFDDPILALLNDDTDGVGLDDYIRWKENFGQHVGTGADTADVVPEPSALCMACPFGALIMISSLAKRRTR